MRGTVLILISFLLIGKDLLTEIVIGNNLIGMCDQDSHGLHIFVPERYRMGIDTTSSGEMKEVLIVRITRN